MNGSFPVDLVLFGMIAAFLVLRLRSILGRRTGFERNAQPPLRPAADGPVIEARAEPVQPAPTRPLPDPASPTGVALASMASQDRSFTPAGFLNGAEKAFRLIVTAFAEADRARLRPLLGEELYAAFDQAIAAREAAGERQHAEVRDIPSATIEAAALHGSHASITVKFVSDQVSYVTGKDGQITTGTEALTELTDIWTFERDLTSRDPTWKLVAAQVG
jgi:predicted lipid-binding transport protein (Tim44 family)